MISIIVTAYNNKNYIHECLQSIIESCGDVDFEILLGIDNCTSTLKSVFKKHKKYKNLKILFFKNRVGTYIIRNSLVPISKYDNILFFDSDDIMKKNMINDLLFNMKKYDCVKPMFSGFKDEDDITLPKFNTQKNTFGEGVFAINKNVFNEMNGFEPWVCAADSEFNWRLRMNNKTFKYIERVCFYYRRHSTSLTTNQETGMRSKLRMKYHILTKNKKNTKSFSPLDEMVVSKFIEITNHNIDNFLIDQLNPSFEIPEDKGPLDVNNNENVISLIFNKTPKKVVEPNKKPKVQIVSNNPINNILVRKPKVVDKDKITKQRQNIINIKQKTNREVFNEIHPSKPNRRLDLPNIRL